MLNAAAAAAAPAKKPASPHNPPGQAPRRREDLTLICYQGRHYGLNPPTPQAAALRPTPELGCLATLPLIPAAAPESPSWPHFWNIAPGQGCHWWLELEQAEVLALPTPHPPGQILMPLAEYAEKQLQELIAQDELPEVIALYSAAAGAQPRYYLTEKAPFRIIRGARNNHRLERPHLDLPAIYLQPNAGRIGEIPQPPRYWHQPAQQPSPRLCREQLQILQRELNAYHRPPGPERRSAVQKQGLERELAYWQARAALPANPQPWREFLEQELIPDSQDEVWQQTSNLTTPLARPEPIKAVDPARDPEGERAWQAACRYLAWIEEKNALPPPAEDAANAAAKAGESPPRTTAKPPAPAAGPRRRPPWPLENLNMTLAEQPSVQESRAFRARRENRETDPRALYKELARTLLPALRHRWRYAQSRLNSLNRQKQELGARAFALQQKDARLTSARQQEDLEARYYRYWQGQAAELRAAASKPQLTDPDPRAWPGPEPLPPLPPPLEALKGPAPGDQWRNAGLALQPFTEYNGKPSKDRFHVIVPETGYEIADIVKNLNHYGGWSVSAKVSLAYKHASNKEILFAAVVEGLIAQQKAIRAAATARLLLQQHGSPAAALAALGAEFREPPPPYPAESSEQPEAGSPGGLYRRRDQAQLWSVAASWATPADPGYPQAGIIWQAGKPPRNETIYATADQEALLKALLIASLELDELAPGAKIL